METDSFLRQSPELLNVMQMRSFIAVLTVILLGIMSFTNNTDAAGKSNQRGNLVHMVSFKFKESVTKEDIKKVETAFAGLQKKSLKSCPMKQAPTIARKGWIRDSLMDLC